MILSQFISDFRFAWRHAHAEVEVFAPWDSDAIYYYSARAAAEQSLYEVTVDRLPHWAYRLATTIPGPGWSREVRSTWCRNPLRILRDYRTARRAIKAGVPSTALGEIARLPTALVSLAARKSLPKRDVR